MFKKIKSALGMGSAAAPAPSASTPPVPRVDGPYRDAPVNLIYQLLFGDRPDLFKAGHHGELLPPWSTLFSDPPDPGELRKLAGDRAQEGRVRALAYGLLRGAGQPVPPKELLGTIIEVALDGGVDTLAVFADGGARYINQTGKMTVVEGVPNPFQREIEEMLRASRPIVAAIGPWDKERLPAPNKGNIRMSFLVSDGLYFGEGPMEVMQREAIAAPLINAATALLVRIVNEPAGGS